MSDWTIPEQPQDEGPRFIAWALVIFGWPPTATTPRSSAIYVHEWFQLAAGGRGPCDEAADAAVASGWYSYERDGVSYQGRVSLVAVQPQ